MEYVEHKAVWFPAVARVAGVRLRVPTLGQVRLLEAVNSPFLVGGKADRYDCAIALYLLRTPWRRARRRLTGGRLLMWKLRWLSDQALPGAAGELSAFVARALWAPELYVRDGQAAGAFGPASGMAARMALRAVRLGLTALCHERSGAWACAWDVPADAVLAYGVAAGEIEGKEYQTRQETEALQPPKGETAAGGEQHGQHGAEGLPVHEAMIGRGDGHVKPE